MQWVIDLFGTHRITNVYADREFPSCEFIKFLSYDTRRCLFNYSYIIGLEKDHSNMLQQLTQSNTTIFSSSLIESLKLSERLQIINVSNSLILLEVLETKQCKIYKLRSEDYSKELEQLIKQPNFSLSPQQLNFYFAGFDVRSTINFIQRCKGSTLVSYGNQRIKLSDLHQALLRNHSVIATAVCRAFGQRLYVSARRNNLGEMVFIISNQKHKDPFKKYARRWFIETMFGKFKTLGFNLESTHLVDLKRLSSLLYLVAIAYSCCCKIGYVVHSFIKPIKLKDFKHNKETQSRFQFSLFKLGFELLKNFLNNHLFVGVTSAKLLQQILEYSGITPKLNRRSNAYLVVKNFQ